MLKKIFIVTLMFAFSLSSVFAQDTAATTTADTETTGNKPREQLAQNFVDALAAQDEKLLISAIEGGSPQVKAMCFKALSEKGASSETLLEAINRYVSYGLNAPSSQNSDSMVRYQALQAAKAAKSETSVEYISQMLYSEQETSNIIAAAQALGEIGSPKGVAALLFQLRLAKTQAIVYEVAVALGKIGDQAALSDLIDLAQNDQYFVVVRQAAVDAIKNIKPSSDSGNNNTTTTTDTAAQ
ncbi:HEAT repeat domain-containing protein [Brachyspira hampsonii]|uniref:PBS lyase n=1 Tax=Brachyspira hampsonii TaxID=1287055 RepID=A0AAC9TUU8_9SPIR|nr:HEAT repeat domain-containing protein [Brachyspira hampsonii]ASJ20841.1 PBS lyase [Brachyspira hampsonii]ELV04586.1 PBS lyase HEAT domain-containing protein repeat-containing protein [Brachyspira hampsonii 30599]MBW5381141.1 HEAT repeat domain-containing protein [Brachyspira hampsonii]MBW5409806.1 HEAT repeat domain-containing protein [Brachyspira hampsonii]OEJ18960.1 PBS lyase [Brachyspira hampsonii]